MTPSKSVKMSTSSPAPKSMSSRLLTMKFMQRAAASPPSIPAPLDEPSPKRRKTDSTTSSPKFNVDALADQRAVQVAMAGEEAKRQVALEKQALEAGDTRWVLNFEDQKHASFASGQLLRVVQTGFASLDSTPSQIKYVDEEELDDKPAMVGRRSFGKFNKALEKQQDPTFEDSSDSDSEEDGEQGSEKDIDGDDPTNELIMFWRQEAAERRKADRKAKKIMEKAEFMKMAKDKVKEEVNMDGLTSLTGRQDQKCYRCGGPHTQSSCPQKRRRQGGDDGPPRKARRAK